MPLSSDDTITVVHGGRTYVAGVWRYSEALWHWYALWPLSGVEGKIRESDEDITWTRKKLFWWWPFHRSAIIGLLTAAALAPPRQEPRVPSGGLRMKGLRTRKTTMHAALHSDFESLNKDMNKIFKDLDKTISDAMKLR
jgi:hypothetical protein